MRHPILSGTGHKIYFVIWTAILLVHGSVLHFYYGFKLEIAITDSLIYNLLFSAITPGLWYVVRFASLSKDDLSLAATHLVAAIITILIWSSASGYVLYIIFFDRPEYQQFLSDSYMWRLIVGFMYYSISVLVFYLIKYYQDMQGRANRELELQSLLKDSELKMLKSQINPHFIFNSLNSISALTISKPDLAREMVIKLSDFLRYSLGKDGVQMNTLEQEIQNATLYMDIEKIRFGSKLIFEKSVSQPCLSLEVPNLILQPLFENAIKYGVHESIDQVSVRFTCKAEEEMLHILIENDFDSESMPPKGEGIGLENVRKRLRLVYGRSDLLEVNESSNAFGVVIKIPINQDSDE